MLKLKAGLALALVAAAVAGCTANAAVSVTPGASTAPSAAPGANAGTGATIGGTGSGATVEVDGDLAAMYKLGRKWTYDMMTTGPASLTQEMIWEVVKVENGKATLKTTITGGPTGAVSNESMISLAKGTKPESLFTAQYQADGPVNSAAEAVTVKAGSYPNAQKVTFKGKANDSSSAGGTTATANLSNDVTFWWDKMDGLVKQVVVTKMSTSVSSYQLNQTIPSIPGLPTSIPGVGAIPTAGTVNIDTTTTIELKAITR